ncbi:hypothetical protein C6401_15290 [Arthrobacter woluwensis]|nr:hypothetical protein C6401_15290 [Arthrobacter woluwensis]
MMWPAIIGAGSALLGFVLGVLGSRGRGTILFLPSGGRPGSLDTTELHDGISFDDAIAEMTKADEE